MKGWKIKRVSQDDNNRDILKVLEGGAIANKWWIDVVFFIIGMRY